MALATVVAALGAWCVLSIIGALVVAGMVRIRERQQPGGRPVTGTARRRTTGEPSARESGAALLG